MPDKTILGGKRILLVDDEYDIVNSLQQLLPMCDTVKAMSFKEAKELLESQYFDLAILDIMGVDGYRLLQIANEKKVIAVMLTAHSLNPESLLRSFEEGAASYLPKEALYDIAAYLTGIFEAKQKGINPWIQWFKKWGSFFEERFGPKHKEIWQKFISW